MAQGAHHLEMPTFDVYPKAMRGLPRSVNIVWRLRVMIAGPPNEFARELRVSSGPPFGLLVKFLQPRKLSGGAHWGVDRSTPARLGRAEPWGFVVEADLPHTRAVQCLRAKAVLENSQPFHCQK